MPPTRYGPWQELQLLRHRTGYTLRQLAKDSGLLPSQLSMLENGHRWPTPPVIKKLSVALSVPYTMLERPAEQKTETVA